MHILQLPSGALAYLVSILTRTPYILTAHLGDVPRCIRIRLTDYSSFSSHSLRYLEKAGQLPLSAVVRNMAPKTYDVPVVVIPNGIDLKSAQQLSCQEKAESRLNWCQWKVQSTEKCPADLRAAGVTRDYEWKCTVGDGQLMADVRSKIDEYDLNDRTFFHGWVEPSRS